MFISSIILMIGGVISATLGYLSEASLNVSSYNSIDDEMFVFGAVAFVIGFILFLTSCIKKVGYSPRFVENSKYCKECHKHLDSKAKFCDSCGAEQ